MKIKKTLTFSFLLLLTAEFIYNVSGYAIKSGLGRTLGVEMYGRYTTVITFVTMVIIVVGRSIPSAMAKRISENKNNFSIVQSIKKTAAQMQFFIIISLTAIFYLLAPFSAKYFLKDETLTPLVQLSSLIIPTFALSSFHVLYFNGLKRFGAMTALKTSRGIFRMLWIIGLAYSFKLSGAFWGAILAPLSVFLVAIFIEIFIYKDFKLFPKKTKKSLEVVEKYPWQSIISYAKVFVLFTLFYEFFVRMDIYLIKIFLKNDYFVGIYDSAMTVSLIPYYLIFALTFILFPTISNLKSNGNHAKIKKLVKKIIILLFATLIPISVILVFFSDLLINLLYGNEFYDAGNLIPLMLGGTIFGTIFFVLASIWNGAGYTKTPAIITFFAIILSVTLNYIFIPAYGISATAIIFSATSSFMGISLLTLTYFKFLGD
ncbi:MAG: oligosaccharide flippase family protein [Candidatus Moranbacteria bacterium]|nr:oligosaccharide flippase family protein [Candidatus Moranbacteria bacterium]